MPHRCSRLRSPARRWLPAALLVILAACTRAGDVLVLPEGQPAAAALDVIAIPTDPATLVEAAATPPAPALAPRTADSVTRFRHAADSADAVDVRFQLARATLNREATAMQAADRRTRDYAQRYERFHRRRAAAESLRAERDRLRERVAALRARLAPVLPPDEPVDRVLPRAALDTLLVDGRRTRAVSVRDGGARLALEPGRWWIGVAPQGGVPRHVVPIVVRAGARDTVRPLVP